MTRRIVAIGLIVVFSTAAWWILSFNMTSRTFEKNSAMSDAVGDLWGTAHNQYAPVFYTVVEEERKEEMTEEEKLTYIKRRLEEEKLKEKVGQSERQKARVSEEKFYKVVKETQAQYVELAQSDIRVNLKLDYRQKGLLWFSTYAVDFNATYLVKNPFDRKTAFTVEFPFPSQSAVYDNMAVEADGLPHLESHVAPGRENRGNNQLVAKLELEPKASQTFRFRYSSRGLDQWTYQFGRNTDMVKNFKMVMTTNFDRIDFPRNSISPDEKRARPNAGGWELLWEKDSMVSGFQIGMVMPARLNPGPLAAAMSSHAPVSLLFFFFLIFLLQIMREIKIHPMNYFFLAASFFAFNLLFSYLVDHIDIILAFLISSAVSIFLVVSYLRLVVGTRFALLDAGISQLIFQILFSLAHFFKGYTGLTITIGAIITLAVVMRLTAKVDWEEVFKRDKGGGRLPGALRKEPLGEGFSPNPVI